MQQCSSRSSEFSLFLYRVRIKFYYIDIILHVIDVSFKSMFVQYSVVSEIHDSRFRKSLMVHVVSPRNSC